MNHTNGGYLFTLSSSLITFHKRTNQQSTNFTRIKRVSFPARQSLRVSPSVFLHAPPYTMVNVMWGCIFFKLGNCSQKMKNLCLINQSFIIWPIPVQIQPCCAHCMLYGNCLIAEWAQVIKTCPLFVVYKIQIVFWQFERNMLVSCVSSYIKITL